MTRTDTTVVGALVVLLALLTGLVGIPALQATSATPSLGPRCVGRARVHAPTARASSATRSRSAR